MISMCGRTFLRVVKAWQNFDFYPNDTRRIAIIESAKIEHIKVINLMPVSKYTYLAGKITNMHYLQLCK